MNSYKNKQVLVTGGAGFIGAHLVEKLVDLGAQVTILDNFSTGNLANLEAVKAQIKIITGDICDPELAQILNLTTEDFDFIFHLAAATSVPESFENPQKYHNINLTGTLNLLKLFAHQLNTLEIANPAHKKPKFIFSSSSAVYGEKSTICTEQDLCAPTSIYGLNKLMGEQYCQIYSQLYNLPTICLRYFNVYGPRQNPHGSYAAVYTKFAYNLAHNLPITIYGDGTQARDFVTVEQIVTANLQAGLLDYTHLNGQAINIGSGAPIKIIDLLTQLKNNYPEYTSEIKFAPARVGDITLSCANISKAKRLFTSANL
ncbi:MAG TPA: SDR family NAD(P)-dependent oxidoreductase [Candidatus Babeliales bacterium]|nr:SDR family NAD(P)-dependent oxidoreductase [Candidatus Babeliales bacterium]